MGATELLLVIAVLGGIIAVLLPTFRGASDEARSNHPGHINAGEMESSGSRSARDLEERRRAVVESLVEIEADLEAGNLNQTDYNKQRQRYERQAAAVLREIGSLERSGASTGGQSAAARPASSGRFPSALGWVGVGVGFAAIAFVAMSGALSPRGEGEILTGTVPGSSRGGSSAQGRALVPTDMQRLAALERDVAADSNDVEALVELGHLYLSTQRFGEVAQVSMRALSLDSTNPGALTHLGMMLSAEGRNDGAMEAFNLALSRDADFPEALLYKGIISFQSRDFQTATDSWEHYLRVAPPEANVGRVEAMLGAARQAAASQPAP